MIFANFAQEIAPRLRVVNRGNSPGSHRTDSGKPRSMRLAPRRYAILSALTAWRPRAWGRAVAAVMALLSGFAWPALAQSTDDTAGSGTSYVTPFPPGDIYKLQVYGDEFAEALLQGLIAGLGPEDRV